MRKFFQTQWHGIEFHSFAQVSSRKLPDASFYEGFYQALFRRFQDWNQLDPRWLAEKCEIAEFIRSKISTDACGPILSIGCGIGAIERSLLQLGIEQIEVTETSRSPLRWISRDLPEKSLHVGLFPEVLPPDHFYSFIFASALDYCFDEMQWSELLRNVKSKLNKKGRFLAISASCEAMRPSWKALGKRFALATLRQLRVTRREQFWGYMRTPEELRKSFLQAGFLIVSEGFFPSGSYWIEGESNDPVI